MERARPVQRLSSAHRSGVRLPDAAASPSRIDRGDLAAGLQRGSPGAPNSVRHFERDVDSFYAEILVPLVGGANAVDGIRRLELNAAIRHDGYSDVCTTTDPKLSVSYGPTDDLTLRASYGTSFRAPLFSQLFGNSSALFVQGYSDPTRGGVVIPGVLR